MIIAVANQKGGVGKTTTAVNLAATWATNGHRTLIVDMDPQGNAGASLGIQEDSLEWTVTEVLSGECTPRTAINSTNTERLSIMASDIGLAMHEADDMKNDALKNALSEVSADFDRIVIDCPPSLGRLTLCALTASDRVLVPIRAGRLSLIGLRQLLTTVDNVRVRGINPSLRPLGIFVNEAQSRTNLHQMTVNAVRELYADLVLETTIPSNVALAEAVTAGEPIATYSPDAAGNQAFIDLAKEVESVWDRVVRIA